MLQHQYLSLTCEVWSDFATTSVTHVLRTVIKFSGYSDHYGCRCHSQYQLVAKCRFYINRHFDCWGRRSCFFFLWVTFVLFMRNLFGLSNVTYCRHEVTYCRHEVGDWEKKTSQKPLWLLRERKLKRGISRPWTTVPTDLVWLLVLLKFKFSILFINEVALRELQ